MSYLSGVENCHISPSARLIEDYEKELGLKLGEQNNPIAASKLNMPILDQPPFTLLQQDINSWNLWREEHADDLPSLVNTDLHGMDLRRANFNNVVLCRANLSGANLSEASLIGADLTEANLSKATLNKANLSGASLYKADLSEASLTEANLTGTNLRGTNLIGVNLDRADLSGATIEKTHIGSVDLRQVKGLTELWHPGPSHIELYTTKLPPDGSALHFLRGAGVPDEWINAYRATMMHPIQYHSIFISYSSQDETLAHRLHADLQANGVRCWFAPEDMKIGDKIRTRIEEAIHLQDYLLLILSEHSVSNTWIKHEVDEALEREKRQNREVLLPIRIDEAVMQATNNWAAHLRRSRHIGNFTRWADPEEYQRAFERLLRDLKSSKDIYQE
jgi:TIR domain-containing protein/pentapeptide repeat protein